MIPSSGQNVLRKMYYRNGEASCQISLFSRRGTGTGFRLPVRSKLDRDKIWRLYEVFWLASRSKTRVHCKVAIKIVIVGNLVTEEEKVMLNGNNGS